MRRAPADRRRPAVEHCAKRDEKHGQELSLQCKWWARTPKMLLTRAPILDKQKAALPGRAAWAAAGTRRGRTATLSLLISTTFVPP